MLESTEEWGIKNQLASVWMHRGMDLMSLSTETALLQAVSCFNQAIALRHTLPFKRNHWFRYALSAGWVNRGDALRQLDQPQRHAEALKSYDKALGLLRTLPLDQNPLYSRRLAITWLHRGILLQQSRFLSLRSEAVNSFHEAIAVLELPTAAALADYQSLLAGAWANLAVALTNFAPEETDNAAVACLTALGHARAGNEDTVAAQAFLKATDALCRLVLKSWPSSQTLSADFLSVTTDAIEEAMHLSTAQGKQIRPDLIELVCRVFRFGCWIYERYQPHFLVEYIEDYLQLGDAGVLELDPLSLAIARGAVTGAINTILSAGFSFLQTPRRDPTLDQICKLRLLAARLA
jgi:hypothetical protein